MRSNRMHGGRGSLERPVKRFVVPGCAAGTGAWRPVQQFAVPGYVTGTGAVGAAKKGILRYRLFGSIQVAGAETRVSSYTNMKLKLVVLHIHRFHICGG